MEKYESGCTSKPSAVRAMSREDSRDAEPADISFDSDNESPADIYQKDEWFYDQEAGTVTRFHVTDRRARFDPSSVKGCPVDPALLSDARITMAMTDGAEFTLQDSWRARDPRPLPCRWTEKSVFVVGNSAKTQVKIRTEKPVADDQVRRVQTVSGFYGHALRAKGRVANRGHVLPQAWSSSRPLASRHGQA